MHNDQMSGTIAPTPNQTKAKKMDRNLAWMVVAFVTFILPVLFVPVTVAPLQFSKTLVVVFAVAVLYGMYALTSMRRGEMVKYWSFPLVAFSLLPVIYLVTAIFSDVPGRSFFGYRLETDTFGFMLLAALLTNAVVLTVERAKLGGVFKAALAAAWIVIIFQIVQILSGMITGSGVLGTTISNLLGRWNDFGMFVGLAGALSLIAIYAIRMKRPLRMALVITYLMSAFFLALVNFIEAWILFGVVTFGVSALLLAQQTSDRKQKLNVKEFILPLLGLIAAVFFAFWGGGVSAMLQDTFGVTTLEVRPSISGTLEVLQHTYQDAPILGSGPNTFAYQWLQHRNGSVLNTIFWNTEFNVGSGTIPTTFVTGGVVTAALWIIFTVLTLVMVPRALFTVPVSDKSYPFVMLSGVSVLYLLAVHYVYAPSQSLTLLFAIALGIFFASLKGTPLMHTVHVRASSPHRRALMTVGVAVVLVVAALSVYGVSRTYVSSVYHERAISVANAGDTSRAETLVRRAIQFSPQDRYYRTAAQINLAALNQLVNSGEQQENAAQIFQDTLSGAVGYARTAVERDPASFQNWLMLATVYSSVIPLQIQGALDNAVATLEEARSRSPQSPEVDYRLAQIALVGTNDVDVARTYLEAALAKKQDYTQAILLLAQIELNEGNLDRAIESVRAAVYFEPTNAVFLYQLGILLLQDQNYEEAARAFEAALAQQPDYSNAAFFLAQSYAFLDRLDEAALLMAQVAERNPESDLANTYAAALSAGENPFDVGKVTSPDETEDEVE